MLLQRMRLLTSCGLQRAQTWHSSYAPTHTAQWCSCTHAELPRSNAPSVGTSMTPWRYALEIIKDMRRIQQAPAGPQLPLQLLQDAQAQASSSAATSEGCSAQIVGLPAPEHGPCLLGAIMQQPFLG